MLVAELAAVNEAVAATASRLAKVERLADLLRRLEPAEVPVAVAYLSGELPQRQIGVGPAALRSLPAPADGASLTVLDVDAAFSAIGGVTGSGSGEVRRRLVADLFARATEAEHRFLTRLLFGDLRQGALQGGMVEAVARAASVPAADVRRAVMLAGDLGSVAVAAVAGGSTALGAFRLAVGRPLQPMLASTATGIGAALERTGPAAVEWKLDGARIQVHRSGGDVAVFTRSLDDITTRVPEVVEAALALPADAAVLDGEAIALRPDGRPHPFQVTGSRFGTRSAGSVRDALPLTPFLFDALHLDGEDLLDRPAGERRAALAAVAPPALLTPALVVEDVAGADAFLADALARGHEGVLVKSLDAPYEAGRRGKGWVKVKPVHTLDLVVLAVEWGSGRRRGWLSNLHLGARDPATGGFVMLGKTFKGLTDAMLEWQTAHLRQLEVASDDWVVHVRPELVVEIALDGVQRSSRYPGGVALRFARVLRHRPDKRAADADTLDAVRALSSEVGG